MSPHFERIPESEVMDSVKEAKAYAAADFAEVNQAFVDRLVELAAHHERATLLDVGTGPGDIPIRISCARPRWHVVAVDASAAMLAIAQEALRKASLAASILFLHADAKQTPFSPGSFHVVCSNSILHHITDVGSFWHEIKRVSKPGATIFLRDLCRPKSEEQVRLIVEEHAGDESALLQEEFYQSLLSAYTPEEVKAQLDSTGIRGFQVEKVSDRHLDIVGQIS